MRVRLPPPVRIIQRNLLAYRRGWAILASGGIEPVLMLLALGVGVGSLVGEVDVPGGAVAYEQFVAPAMVVTASMAGALADTTFNFFVKFKYAHAYDAMLATPLRVRDVALGEAGWAVVRGGFYATTFSAVMVAFGLMPSWWGLLAIPTGMLVAFAFAGVGLGATTFMRSFVDFDLVFMVMIPLLLLSATFFPLERYPDGVATLVQFTPLYQGVELSRAAVLGDVHAGLLGNAAYLVAMGSLGLRVAVARLAKLLCP